MRTFRSSGDRRKEMSRRCETRDDEVRRSNKAIPNWRLMLSQIAVAAFCLLAAVSTAHAVLVQVLSPAQLPQISSRKGFARVLPRFHGQLG
jgi:hypothetical protein